jgi:RimJ/RimL family protein N-acetyltransferase
MTPFALDRTHPPRRVTYRDGVRHLVLRPWSLDDVDALLAAIDASRPALREFMPWAHFPSSRELQYDYLARVTGDYFAGREFSFGMFDGGDGTVLGGVGLHPRVALNPRALEVGYWCHSAHAGRGWTTLAVQVAVALCFGWLGVDRCQVMHDDGNLASRRVVEKCGFVYEGTQRNVTAAVAEEVRLGGYRGTGRHRVYALVPEDLPNLSWLPAVHAALTLTDALGVEHGAG